MVGVGDRSVAQEPKPERHLLLRGRQLLALRRLSASAVGIRAR
ncbi:hypothetical protein ACIRP3_18550 [Streptomyces sp. NPDC101209]